MAGTQAWRHESLGRAWLRRSLTIPAYLAATALFVPATAVALPFTAALDVARRRRLALSRCLLMANVYLLAEAVGMAVCAATWFRFSGWRRDPGRAYLDANYALQAAWAAAIFEGARRLFALRVEVEGESSLRPGPVVMLARHASPLDNLVPAVFASSRQRLRLRWVINRWLLRDPCLDIVGNRLPNVFVDAGSREPRGQSGRIAALAAGLGADEGVLIYPEGALFSPSRLARAAERLDGSTDEAARAARLRSVLPPRSGAFIAALGALPEADVIVCSHRGLDAAGNYRALLSGALLGATVAIRFERVPRCEIPVTPEGQSAWLWDRWEMMDRWVAGG